MAMKRRIEKKGSFENNNDLFEGEAEEIKEGRVVMRGRKPANGNNGYLRSFKIS